MEKSILYEKSLVKLILLSIVTLGIYGLWFLYAYIRDINILCEGDGKDSMHFILVCLLSSITFGIYSAFWMYIQGDRLYNNAERYGLKFNESGTTIVLWYLAGSFIIVGPFFAWYFMINNQNEMIKVYNQNVNNYTN